MPDDCIDLKVSPKELRLDPTLICGQAFRWMPTGPQEWTCALFGHAIELKQTPKTIMYRSLGKLDSQKDDSDELLETELRGYFQLHINLQSLCKKWTSIDPAFAKLAKSQAGVRILRQPVVENLFTFIASSNNNIKRITMLVDRLCQHYGSPIDTPKGRFYTFPTIQQIAKDPDIETTFSELGFGYRAKYYAKTMGYLMSQDVDPEEFLAGLRAESLEVARAELLKFNGVGPKVADCVLLMSLDKADVVPVDTHIWQIAQRKYVSRLLTKGKTAIKLPDAKQELAHSLAKELKTLTRPGTKGYQLAQQLFVALFSPYAGWAQGMLFSSDLETNIADPPPSLSTPTKRKRK